MLEQRKQSVIWCCLCKDQAERNLIGLGGYAFDQDNVLNELSQYTVCFYSNVCKEIKDASLQMLELKLEQLAYKLGHYVTANNEK